MAPIAGRAWECSCKTGTAGDLFMGTCSPEGSRDWRPVKEA